MPRDKPVTGCHLSSGEPQPGRHFRSCQCGRLFTYTKSAHAQFGKELLILTLDRNTQKFWPEPQWRGKLKILKQERAENKREEKRGRKLGQNLIRRKSRGRVKCMHASTLCTPLQALRGREGVQVIPLRSLQAHMGDSRYSPSLSLPRHEKGLSGQHHAPGACYPPVRNLLHPLYERLGGPQSRLGAEDMSQVVKGDLIWIRL